MKDKRLLIVANQPSLNTQSLAHCVLTGTRNSEVQGVSAILKEPAAATVDDVLHCDGIIVGSTENFGYMAGMIKDFFERIYYPCLEQTQGLALGVYVRAGNDGSGALTSIDRITTGLRWSLIQPALLMKGEYTSVFDSQCTELGLTMAAGLEAGIF